LRHAHAALPAGARPADVDVAFLADETRWSPDRVREVLDEIRRTTG
jgi:hypothetical protein